MEFTDSLILTAAAGIIAVMYLLEVVKPFLNDWVLKAKSKTPDAYRIKKTTGDFVRLVGLPLSIAVAFVFFYGSLALGQIVIAGIIIAAIADGSYSRLLRSFREQVQNSATTTVKQVAVQQARDTAARVAAPVAAATAATITEEHVDNAGTDLHKTRPEGP
jgi:hypothetical protein